MTAEQIAIELDVNIQTVRRGVRALGKDDPQFLSGVPIGGITNRAYDYDADLAQDIKTWVKDHSRKFKAPSVKMVPSTKGQRDAWLETWQKRFLTAHDEHWGSLGTIVGMTILCKYTELLESSAGSVRVGDRVLGLIEAVDPSRFLLDTDPFSNWLQESGFRIEGDELPA